MAGSHALSTAFEPSSIAVIGASDAPGSVGRVIFRNLVEGGYRGALYAVNPKYESIQDHPCHRSIEDIGRPVDLAIIATPARMLPTIVAHDQRVGPIDARRRRPLVHHGRRPLQAAHRAAGGRAVSGGQGLAHVRRILTGHSDRALVHAVADVGLEIKIEVPAESVRDVNPDRGYVLMVSWSLLELPRAAEPATASSAPAEPWPPAAAPGGPLTSANAVDAEFMALMARARRPAPEHAASTPTATSGPGPEQQIAALLRLVPARPT